MSGAARAAGSAYFRLCERFPWGSAFTVCFVKGSLSDIFAQKALEKRERIDVVRNVCFAAYGGWYLGWVQHFIYNRTYSYLYGHGTGVTTVAKKLITDHLIHVPLLHLPAYFLWQELLLVPLKRGDAPFPRLEVGVLSDTFSRWYYEVFGLLCEYWKIWTPAHLVTFGLMPEPLRITWIAGVSLIWMVVLSFLTHQTVEAGSLEAAVPSREPPSADGCSKDCSGS
mmetsp:Transcript_63561/g.138432  ORF Transcript_63561/g.138432 Transcript_63561/m.138432 type:complete len:225 (-) Transcript_63561:109-783(-)